MVLALLLVGIRVVIGLGESDPMPDVLWVRMQPADPDWSDVRREPDGDPWRGVGSALFTTPGLTVVEKPTPLQLALKALDIPFGTKTATRTYRETGNHRETDGEFWVEFRWSGR